MPNIKSAKKRMRQGEKRRLCNKGYRSAMKTQVKKFLKAIEQKDVDQVKQEFSITMSILDRMGRKRILHPNNVNRKKSKLQAKYQQFLTEQDS